MYAIETKKRKFDRILESIKDSSAVQSRNQPLPRNKDTSTVSLVPVERANEPVKKRRVTSDPTSSRNVSGASATSQTGANFLPSSREAFLDRLETFGPITKWHVPSNEAIGAAAWAKRGWRCTSTDLVSCGSCQEQLLVKIDKIDSSTEPLEENDDELALAMDVHAGLIEKYREMIVIAHSDKCPWLHRGCIDSIQRIGGLLNAAVTISAVQTRYNSIIELLEGSDITLETPTAPPPRSTKIDLTHFKFADSASEANENALLLAVCGWQKAEDRGVDIIECRHCFRSLGLWLYRGAKPTVEKLDAIDSHLEYCPWRSAEAQDTQVEVEGSRSFVPGWYLVAQTVEKRSMVPSRTTTDERAVSESQDKESSPKLVTGKEREQKMKDLLRRVKELKKPFNVKSLLKRNKKPA